MNFSSLASQSFFATLEKLTVALDREKLLGLVSAMAHLIPPERWEEALLHLRNIGRDQQIDPEPLPVAEIERVLDGIADLRLDIQARMEAIEDGTLEDFDDYYDYNEEPDPVSDEQLTLLTTFFAEAGLAFAGNDKPAAGKIYEALFELVDEVEEIGLLPRDDIDLHRERARYARCAYENAEKENRPRVVLSAIGTVAESRYFSRDLPLLCEVKACDSPALPGWEDFLPAWQRELAEMDFRAARVAHLLLEATAMASGVTAVAELAERWGAEQPLGYLFLLERVAEDGDWHLLGAYAREALTALPEGEKRARAADFLVTAGQKLGIEGIILAGYREGLLSLPTNAALATLVAEATRQNRRSEELADIIASFAATQEKRGTAELLVKALLMAGRIDEAFAVRPTDTALGWSSDTTGLNFAAILHLLSSGNPDCTLCAELLRDQAERPSMVHWEPAGRSPGAAASLFTEIKAGLDGVNRGSLALDHYRWWAGDLGERRVAGILENQHRSAYGRAALVLAGLAETLAAQGKMEKAQQLIWEYRRVLFPRHTAFHRELKAAVDRSKILAGRISQL